MRALEERYVLYEWLWLFFSYTPAWRYERVYGGFLQAATPLSRSQVGRSCVLCWLGGIACFIADGLPWFPVIIMAAHNHCQTLRPYASHSHLCRPICSEPPSFVVAEGAQKRPHLSLYTK
jgi:hypothetical protein